ncbi:MAG TPA: oxygen-independent coproporphyrinogen III oxidase [Candidatus Scatomonas merdigallinarum]|nr:oxygen-independent coproporphyrinogen III oxidase [Candidatus Scatomonas merdigallinarum]
MDRKEQELELYAHIPFCVRKCGYCDFLSGTAEESTREAYLLALAREIRRAGQDAEGCRAVSVFFGGGTPTVLTGGQLSRLLSEIKKSFRLAGDCEITLEANPGTLDPEKLRLCREAGFNRISIGCQSADNRELRRLGRIHTWEEFLEGFRQAREAGFSNINVDLMSGIPGQTLVSWETSLRKTAELGPEHISAYSLILEEGTPFYKNREKLDLPDEDTERRMYERTGEILEEYGCRQYEISNYAREGYRCRHNLGYWTGREYLGLGLGASSLWRDTRFRNTDSMEEYLKDSGNLPKIRREEEKLSASDRQSEYMILGLRLTEGISLAGFRETFGTDVRKVWPGVLEKYEGYGLLEEAAGRLKFTGEGISLSNVVLAEFLPEK